MITFLGDVALIDHRLKSEYKPANPYVFNLEYVIGDPSQLSPVPDKINLCAAHSNFIALFGTDPVAVNVVNNHILDFGEKGFQNTIDQIEKKNIKVIVDHPVCLGENVYACSYMLFEDQPEFLFDYDKAEKHIRQIKDENPEARVVIQMHWGIENHGKQTAEQTEIAHWLIDHGADLIIGHHPHCLQPIEEYKGKYIFYSLGNTLFGKINQPSHYDANGIARRVYRFNWQSWNRKSLAVTYDSASGQVTGIDRLYQRGNTLVCRKANILPAKLKKLCRYSGSDLLFRLRKYYLFFVSNAFVDGKLFDINAVRNELGRRK